MRLGVSERRALKAAILFREQDQVLFEKLAPLVGEEERYILATRDSRETMEKLLGAEIQRMADEDEDGADGLAGARAPDKVEARGARV